MSQWTRSMEAIRLDTAIVGAVAAAVAVAVAAAVNPVPRLAHHGGCFAFKQQLLAGLLAV